MMTPIANTRASDPYFSSVKLLLHGNGADGAAIVDSSTNVFAVTAGGNAACRVLRSRFGGSSIGLDGTGDYLTADNTFAAPGTGDMTVEFWICPGNNGKQQCVLDLRQANGDAELRIDHDNTFDGGLNDGLVFFVGNAARATTAALSIDTWYHVAVSRVSTVWRFYLNGVQQGSSYTNATNMARRKLSLGTYWDARSTASAYKFQGWIDDFRLTMGVGRYVSNFTPPASQYPDG